MLVKIELDDLDKAIIELLVQDCRKSVRAIARELGKPPSLIAKRVKRLFEEKIIERCTAILNMRKLGFRIMALIMLNVKGAHIEDVEKILAEEKNVRAVYDITGTYDVAVLALFKSVEELDRFVKRMLKNPYIERSVTSVIFKAVKDEPTVPPVHGGE